MVTDGHNHTKHFSPDAGQSIDELIKEAKKRSQEQRIYQDRHHGTL